MSVLCAIIGQTTKGNKMPNWVYNTLTIEGSPSSVQKLKEQVSAPFTREHDQWNMETGKMELKEYTYSNPVFSFWNIIKPTDLATYALQKDHKADDSSLFGGNNWYDWNVRNWGTKWDVAVADGDEYSNTQITDEGANGENYVIVYRFDTAWSPANEVIAKLSEQYPTLLFTNSYEEETGWGGEDEFLAGENTATWDYESKCWECSAEDALELCEDCDMNVCVSCGINDDGDQCEHLGVTKANV